MYFPREIEMYVYKKICVRMFTEVWFIITPTWKQLKYSLTYNLHFTLCKLYVNKNKIKSNKRKKGLNMKIYNVLHVLRNLINKIIFSIIFKLY